MNLNKVFREKVSEKPCLWIAVCSVTQVLAVTLYKMFLTLFQTSKKQEGV